MQIALDLSISAAKANPAFQDTAWTAIMEINHIFGIYCFDFLIWLRNQNLVCDFIQKCMQELSSK